ncbi:MAG: hypothetical protein ACI4CT_09695 [Lachnospiraceae bacterium]
MKKRWIGMALAVSLVWGMTGMPPVDRTDRAVTDRNSSVISVRAATKNRKKVTVYHAGTYEVGETMKPGTYAVFATGHQGSISVWEKPPYSLDHIVALDRFTYNTIIKVSKGEHVRIQHGRAIAFEDSKVKTDGSGMFEVGKNLKPGTYKIEPLEHGEVSIATVYRDAKHRAKSTISIMRFRSKKEIVLEKGQYLRLQNAKITDFV